MARMTIRPVMLVVAMFVCGESASAQVRSRNVVLNLTVDPHKPSGSAWDAFGGAPDIAICTNSAFGQECFASGTGVYASPSQFARSRCPDNFACTFTVTVPATGPFNLSIYDVDIDSHDLIGSCMVTGVGPGSCGSARLNVRVVR